MTRVTARTAAVLDAQSNTTTTTSASHFLDAWDKAWATHNAHALGELHTSNAVTINRFGTLLMGRAPTEKALGFLHSKEGPFGHSTFPPLQLLEARSVASEVIIVNAGWKNPIMHTDGKISETEWSDMLVTFVLVREGETWRALQIDAHNVEKMNLPFSSHGQKS